MSLALTLWAGAAAWKDASARRIPNLLLLAGLVAALLAFGLTGTGLAGASWPSSLIGAAIAAMLFCPGWALGLAGAGDVKFAALAGFLLGTARSLEMLALAAVVLGAASALVLLRSGREACRRRIPAGPAVATGFVVELLGGPWLLH